MKKPFFRENCPAFQRGFTLIEILIVIGIMGALALAIYPSLRNTLEIRNLENTAKEVQTAMQQAKFQAVKTKLDHRVRFEQRNNIWYFFIEEETAPDTWQKLAGYVDKSIPPQFNLTVTFPNQTVVFSPLGLVSNYVTNQNSLTLQSLKLKGYAQDDLRTLNVYAGGSIQYLKSGSG